ncbi:MAG: serine acetyltransferase [Deltaproteobacteria bacterium]|nr:serine acetyltransferase [Deltaproteobacteria bacterium]
MVLPPPDLVDRLLSARRAHSFPSQVRPLTQAFAHQVLATLFPHFAPSVIATAQAVSEDLIHLEESLARLQRAIAPLHPPTGDGIPDRFLAGLGELHQLQLEDAEAIFIGDPAARSIDEVVLTYPGFFAIAIYRVAHALHELGLPLVPRLLTEYAHEKTGVDIHPGAHIGRRFCIDHGTGVVIGETTRIGDGVKIYQGVTLGAATVQKQQANQKRHPTIEDEVVIYAGATILGGNTVIGHHSVVAGNAWLTQSVPAWSMVSRKSEIRPRQGGDVELDFII